MRAIPSPRYPAARVVAEMFDLEVLTSQDDCNGEPGRAIVALGTRPEPDAGIRVGQVTPYFEWMADLDYFCLKHLPDFEKALLEEETPDATNWPV